ncbi:DUF1127 domain-containing protein [Rhizobium rhizogenes]|uniref:DUF1127 domain-containing protein n=1 Tax=Rhizobium rhizogenes TaxID=359 RepID=UPI00226DD286|nr:DUF1127 domain-containing protein [Rhizobium rhizogenes]
MTIDVDRPLLAATGEGRDRHKPGFLLTALASFLAYLEKRGTRWDLRELTDDQLRDIGVTAAEARAEVSKSWFWD